MRVSHTGLEPRTGRLQAGLLLTRLSLALDRRCRATKAPSSPRPQTWWASSSGAPHTYGCSPCLLRLQPVLPTVAACASYGCSLRHIRLQVRGLRATQLHAAHRGLVARPRWPARMPHGARTLTLTLTPHGARTQPRTSRQGPRQVFCSAAHTFAPRLGQTMHSALVPGRVSYRMPHRA